MRQIVMKIVLMRCAIFFNLSLCFPSECISSLAACPTLNSCLCLQEPFSLHLSFDEEVEVGETPAMPASPSSSHDPGTDSDDSNEVLDKAPGLHLNVDQKIRLLLLLATKKRHKLTYAAAEDIIELAGVCSLESNDETNYAISKHIMKSAIEKYSFDMTEHHVCPSCGKYVGIVSRKRFQCDHCNRKTTVAKNKKNGFCFLYLPLRDQLIELLENLPDNVLIDPENRTKISDFNYEDIYDGCFHQNLFSEDTITLNFFIDGVQVRLWFYWNFVTVPETSDVWLKTLNLHFLFF